MLIAPVRIFRIFHPHVMTVETNAGEVAERLKAAVC